MILLPGHNIKKLWHLNSMTTFTHHFPLNTPHKKCRIVGLIDLNKNKNEDKGRKSSTTKEFMLEDFRLLFFYFFLLNIHFSIFPSFISLIVRDLFIVFILIITVGIQYKSQWEKRRMTIFSHRREMRNGYIQDDNSKRKGSNGLCLI